jgi:hypothetical protein
VEEDVAGADTLSLEEKLAPRMATAGPAVKSSAVRWKSKRFPS